MKNLILFSLFTTALLGWLSFGQLVMLLGVVVLILAHEFGHWFVARLLGFEVERFSIGFGSSPRLVFGKFWGTEFQITPWLLGGYVSIDPTSDVFQKQAIWRRASVMSAGVVMNFLLAVLISFVLLVSTGQPQAVYQDLYVYRLSDQVKLAAEAGIHQGDRLIAVDGVTNLSPSLVNAQMLQHRGTAARITVQRDGANIDFSVTPDTDGHIGIIMSGVIKHVYRPMSIGQSAAESFSQNFRSASNMLVMVPVVLHMVPLPSSLPASAADLHGMVAIVQLGGEALGNGFYSFFSLLSLISLNFAVINVLPIPVLDGGHLGFLAWEKLTGKAVSKEKLQVINGVFVLLLAGVIFYGLYNDFAKPVLH